jgi:hypothetical protein
MIRFARFHHQEIAMKTEIKTCFLATAYVIEGGWHPREGHQPFFNSCPWLFKLTGQCTPRRWAPKNGQLFGAVWVAGTGGASGRLTKSM